MTETENDERASERESWNGKMEHEKQLNERNGHTHTYVWSERGKWRRMSANISRLMSYLLRMIASFQSKSITEGKEAR